MIHTTQECRIGDALKLTKEIPEGSIDLIATSPPYWGLRDYGVDGQIGLEPTLEEYHDRLLEVTAECMRVLKPTGVMFWNHGDSYFGDSPVRKSAADQFDPNEQHVLKRSAGGIRRSAKSQGGLRPKCMTMQNERLIIRMIDDQGWILRNRIIWNKPNGMPSSVTDRFSNKYEPVYMLVKSNDTNYYYNSKTGVMQRDKPPGTKGEEGIDWDWKEVGGDYSESDTKIQAKDAENIGSPRARVYREKKVKKVSNWIGRDYWFDLDAVRKPYTEPMNRWGGQKLKAIGKSDWDNGTGQESYRDRDMRPNPLGKNPGDVWDLKSPEDDWKQLLEVMSGTVGVEAAISTFESYMQSRNVPADVWTIPTQPYAEAHFATFPTSLVEPIIKAACPAEICPVCGLARERITDKEVSENKATPYETNTEFIHHGEGESTLRSDIKRVTIGWTSCNCNAGWIAGTVLDPFAGSGTVGEVARKLNRNAILLELNSEYGKLMAERTMANMPPLSAYFGD